MPIGKDFPIRTIEKIAKVESQRRQFYRPIYSIHKSWARRPGSTFRALGLAHFSDAALFNSTEDVGGEFYKNHNFSDKIILDPFCGGGTSLVELNRLGVKSIGIDLNPVAWFTTKKELDYLNIEEFDQKTTLMTDSVGRQIKKFYQTKCSECGSHHADIMYTFWVRTIQCPHCHSIEDLFKYYIIGKKQRKSSETLIICPECDLLFYSEEDLASQNSCPSCNTKFIPKNGNCRKKQFSCTKCEKEYRLVDIINKDIQSFSSRQIAIEFYCNDCKFRGYKAVAQEDIENYNELVTLFNSKKGTLTFPRESLPSTGSNIKNLKNYGFKTFADLFNPRQLLSLSLILDYILSITDQNLKEFFISAFSSCLEFHTVLCPYNYTMKQIVNVFNFQSFLIPLQYVENNVWGTVKGNGTFRTYLDRIKKGKTYCESPFEIIFQKNQISRIPVLGDRIYAKCVESFHQLVNSSTPDSLLIAGSSTNLVKYGIPDQSIDLVLTDPPYFDYIQYSELANFFYVWLRLVLRTTYPWFKAATVVNEDEVGAEKDGKSFVSQLIKVFKECYRVLKENSPLIFTFHHSTAKAWILILKALKESNFLLEFAFPIISEFHARPVSGSNIDLILVCKKLKEEDIRILRKENKSLKEDTRAWMQNYSQNSSQTTKGKREELLSQMLPLLSLHSLHETDNALKKTLEELFQMKK